MNAPIQLTLMDLDTAGARALAACNDPAAGTAVITVRPGIRRPGWLARDLLTAVGVRHDVSGQTGRDADDRALAALWLHAHGLRDVIVVGLEALPADLLPELIELTTLSGTSLWLIADQVLPDDLTSVLADWPVQPCPPQQFSARWLTAADTPPADADPVPAPSTPLPPVVPLVDFTVFLATARRQLSVSDFAAVEQRYVAERDAALEQVAAGAAPVQVLRTALGQCRSASAAAVTVRAVQAAAFRHRVHLRVRIDMLLALDDYAPVAAAADPQTWELLHTYRQPLRQAACALTLAGLSPTEQAQLLLGDLDPLAPAVRVQGSWRALPDAARPTLVALLASRRVVGAGDRDLLLARLDGSPVGPRTLPDMVATVQRETGVRLTVGQVERVPEPTARWARRRGITVSTLEV